MSEANPSQNPSKAGNKWLNILLAVGLLVIITVFVLMLLGPIVGNVFTTINDSLSGIDGGYYAPEANLPMPEFEAAPQSGASAEGDTAKQDSAIYNTGAPVDAAVFNRMVIKNAEISLLVKDSDIAIDGVTQLVGDVQGYIVSSQIWYVDNNGTNYKYATITIGIPSDQFETVLRRLRNMSIRVLNESASGQDVTDQYVDLQAQLSSLEATRDRIKSFLDQAKTVDEALKINQQLSEIEAQIEQVKGQMNYLSDRSAFSTVNIQIEPDLPPATPTPSPTPRPTATPVPWLPGETIKESAKTVTVAYQGIIDFLIWFVIVLLPILLPPALIVWFVVRLLRRKPKG